MPACCSLDRIYNTNGPNKHSQQALMVTIRISTLKKNLIIMRKLCNYSLSQLQFWHVWMNPPSAALTGVCSHCHPSWIPVKKTGYATARAQSCPGVEEAQHAGTCAAWADGDRPRSKKAIMIQMCQVVQRWAKNTWRKTLLPFKSKSFTAELACATGANEASYCAHICPFSQDSDFNSRGNRSI